MPKEVLDSMVKAHRAWGEFLDEFEDYMLSLDKGFLFKARRAREEHKEGRTKSFQELKKKLGV